MVLQLTLSCAVREWFVVAQPSSNTEGFPVRTSCPEPKTPLGELLELRQIRPLMADSTQNIGMSDQLAVSVQYGPIDDTEVAAEQLASRGACDVVCRLYGSRNKASKDEHRVRQAQSSIK